MKLFATLAILFALTTPVFAQQNPPPAPSPAPAPAQADSKEAVFLPNPFVDKKGAKPTTSTNLSAEEIIQKYVLGNAINVVLGLVGSLALVMFVYGGYLWLISGGNSDTIKKGKNTMIYASLGLVIIFASAILVQKVIDALTTGN